MSILIGLFTSSVLLLVFRILEKKVLGKVRIAEISFVLLIVFLAYIYNPLSHPLEWLSLSLLFYAALDDMLTLSFRIELPIVSYILFVSSSFDIEQVCWSIGIALGIYVFAKLTKDALVADGDAFMSLPLIYFTTTHHVFPAMYLALILGGITFTMIELFFSRKMYPFIPLMITGCVIAVTKWQQSNIIFFGTILVCICYVLLLWKKRKIQN